MRSVLVVDDEPASILGVTTAVDWPEFGLDIVATADSGYQALEIIARQPIDLLIVDVKMPGMTGLELIATLRRRRVDIACIILSGYDDFDYVKRAIALGVENYLLKPINTEELAETLLSTIQKIDRRLPNERVFTEHVLARLVSNRMAPAEINDRAVLVGLDPAASGYQVGILRLYPRLGATLFRLGSDPDNVIEVVQAGLDAIAQALRPLAFIDQAEVVVIDTFQSAVGEPWPTTQFAEVLTGLQATIRKSCAFDVFATLGKPVPNLADLPESFNVARALQTLALVQPLNGPPVRDQHSVELKPPATGPAVPTAVLAQLRAAVVAGTESEMVEIVSQTITIIYRDDGQTGTNHCPGAAQVVVRLIGGLFAVLRELGIACGPLESAAARLMANSSPTGNDPIVDRRLLALVNEARQLVAQRLRNRHPLVREITAIIHGDFSRELSLKTLAHQHNVNPSYLGQLFKSETGELFSSYLNRVRIDHAKRLLSETVLTTHDIAANVGYSSHGYFYRVFKSITGQTPSEYKDHGLTRVEGREVSRGL